MEIDQELKDLGELKNGFQNTTPKYLLAFIDALGSTNNLIILYHPTPSPILKKGAASEEQVINFNILQSFMWRMIQIKIATI